MRRKQGKPVIVKSMLPNKSGEAVYYETIAECCKAYGIRYEYVLEKLINEGGLAPDGKTYFDYPSKWELEEIRQGQITLVGPSKKRKCDYDTNGTV